MLSEEKEELTVKDKIIRFIGGLFLTILVGTLVITFIPNEAGQNSSRLLTGQDSFSAGKIGDENITMDYFQAARRDCYQRYKDSQPQAANDATAINSCAYSGIKNLKVNNVIANSIGYEVSVQKVKETIYEQAKQYHKESSPGAGYADSEKLSLEDIYKNLLRSVPLNYRQDMMTAIGLFQDYLINKLEISEDEKNTKADADNLRVVLNYVQFSEADLLNKLDSTIKISDEELKKDYDDSVKNGTAPKNNKGEIPSFEERKAIIYNKLKSEKKQTLVAELKGKIQAAKSGDKDVLKTIAELSGSKTESTKKSTLSDLSKSGGSIRFPSNSTFLKDLVEIQFGQNKVGGPYVDGDKTAYVEFNELVFENNKTNKKEDTNPEYSADRMKIYTILEEINQSVAGRYPIYRKLEKVD